MTDLDLSFKIQRWAFSLFSISLTDCERPLSHATQIRFNPSLLPRFFPISKAESSFIRSKLKAGGLLKISQSQKLNASNFLKTKKAMEAAFEWEAMVITPGPTDEMGDKLIVLSE